MKLGFGKSLWEADLGLSRVSEFPDRQPQILPLILLTGGDTITYPTSTPGPYGFCDSSLRFIF